MARRWKIGIAGLAIACIAIAAMGFVCHKRDRVGFLAAMCRVGLPNFSRPAMIRPGDLGCAILGPRRRVTGVLLSGYEAVNFDSPELGPSPEGGGFGGTWYTPNQIVSQSAVFEAAPNKPIPGLCGIYLVSVTVEGWATVSPGRFGHLNIYSREFFEDRVIAVGPPPPELVADMQRRWAEQGIGDCP